MNKKSNYALIGASGLIGGCIFREIIAHTDADITLLTRRPLHIVHSRCKEIIVDFSDQDSLNQALQNVDAVFVAIGTTQRKVKGDTTAYRKIDFDIPVAVAKACAENAIPKLLLVSSVGASTQSRNFYLHLKGEVEDAIEKMSIGYVGIFQPSLLLGSRSEFRPAERLSQLLVPVLSFLLPPHYRPISAQAVAAAMVREAGVYLKGVKRYTYREMMR